MTYNPDYDIANLQNEVIRIETDLHLSRLAEERFPKDVWKVVQVLEGALGGKVQRQTFLGYHFGSPTLSRAKNPRAPYIVAGIMRWGRIKTGYDQRGRKVALIPKDVRVRLQLMYRHLNQTAGQLEKF